MVKGNTLVKHSDSDASKVTDDDASKVTTDTKFESSSESGRNSLLTPRTEASTPESAAFTTYSIVDSAKKDDTAESSKDDSNVERCLQRHLSQTDNHIQLLDRNGDLNEVVGSQSMLSQEIIDHEHIQSENDGNEDTSRSDGNSYVLGDLGLPEGSQSKSSIGIAKRLGLLTNTQEEENYDNDNEATDTVEQENTNDVNKSQNEAQGRNTALKKEEPSRSPKNDSRRNTVEKEPLSGLDLLTQVGIKEANKLPLFVASTKSNSDNHDKHVLNSTKSYPAFSRENEGFGSLLDAVAKITEQEASGGLMMNWHSTSTTVESTGIACATKSSTSKESGKRSKKRKVAPLPLPRTKRCPVSKQRKSEVQKLKEKVRREKIEQENERAQAIAKKAAMIAERTITDPVIAKKLLLSMALARENPRSVPQTERKKGHIISEGFFWAHYPPLEFVLKKHMAEYYELSTHQCQSRQQQAFNNYMVDVVKDVAEAEEWEFADSFCDKSLRDRIRCYYKTHIQNAKKRLRTMVRNPTKRANAKHLCEHIELIEHHSVDENCKESKSGILDRKKCEK